MVIMPVAARPQLRLRSAIPRPQVRAIPVPTLCRKNNNFITAYIALATVALGILLLKFSPNPEGSTLARQQSALTAVTLKASAIVAGALGSR